VGIKFGLKDGSVCPSESSVKHIQIIAAGFVPRFVGHRRFCRPTVATESEADLLQISLWIKRPRQVEYSGMIYKQILRSEQIRGHPLMRYYDRVKRHAFSADWSR